uniref:Uncharacterized protein n=1 Tax=Cryptomonas curvata TaxID=233186 RepID=A0A7S0MBS0_9CRYP|mmetsp:Transcript_30312/g.63436  ORF Transcript_30312/g.63436 Transcript_30312/m.63436 type:complete len:180 (+) Transcript_30312:91-630(+)
MDGMLKKLEFSNDINGSAGFTITDWSLQDLQQGGCIKNQDYLLTAFDWALPFGGIPILSVSKGSKAEFAGALPYDVIIAATCDISSLRLNTIPKSPRLNWQLTSASSVEFDLSMCSSPEFAGLFRTLLGHRLSLTIARSSRPMPDLRSLAGPLEAGTSWSVGQSELSTVRRLPGHWGMP